MDASSRFWVKVDKRGPDECWPWTAATYANGYGMFGYAKGHTITAHRFAWIDTHGPIEGNQVVDHLCHNEEKSCPGGYDCPHRRCCNPAHLGLKTRKDNVLAGRRPPNQNSGKTHCKNGHPFDAANTYITPKGSRLCRKCHAAWQLRYYHAHKKG